MSALSPILPMLHEFYQQADWTECAAKYVTENDLDLEEICAKAGVFAVLPLTFAANGLFDFGGTVVGAVIEVYAENAETTIDLCAWRTDHPQTFATAMGAASVLGSANIANPASWAFDQHLAVHRTPLEWLKAGGQGACILDHRYALHELGQALGPLLAQDEKHAADLRRLLCRSPVDPAQIIYPRNTISKAA